jgi:ABC-type branched-subunit amino acid transport system substrate-binding protein
MVQQLILRVGQVLGAAGVCKDIPAARIKAVTDKIMAVAIGSAVSKEEFAVLIQNFDASEAEGQRSVTSGKITCKGVERDLAELERASALPPEQAQSSGQVTAQLQPPPLRQDSQPVAISPGATRGVTDREIRFGMSAPFSGPSKELGQQLRLGIQTAFNLANEKGGVNGRQLKLIAADDGYEPTKTAETMAQLYNNDQVFGFIGNVGTPTAMVSVPFALERRALFFGPFSGASMLRRDPPDRYVFNVRASYAQETEAVVRYLVKVRRLKPEQIAVFAQQDAFGDSGFSGVAKAMRALRGGDQGAILRLGYKRNTIDVDEAVAQLKKVPPNGIKAVVMVASYRAAAKFIEKTHDVMPGLIYTNVSFVGSTALANELMLLGPRFANGVIVTQVVPAVDGYSSVVLDYKNALARYFPGESPDYVSLEGFITANILIEALKRTGTQVDTERVVEAIESMSEYDMGLGTPITYGRADHQGSDKVWGTQLSENGKYEPIELQ